MVSLLDSCISRMLSMNVRRAFDRLILDRLKLQSAGFVIREKLNEKSTIHLVHFRLCFRENCVLA